MKLRIDDEFRKLIPPLAAEELDQLEHNILADGCRDPLVVWMRDQPIREQCIRKQIGYLSQVIDESAARIKELDALICTMT